MSAEMHPNEQQSPIKLFDLLIRARRSLDAAESYAVCPSVPLAAQAAWVAVADGHAEQIATILRRLAQVMIYEQVPMMRAGEYRVDLMYSPFDERPAWVKVTSPADSK